MKKQIISVLLTLSLTFSTVGQTVTAYKEFDNNGLIKLDAEKINECVKDVALEWAELIEPNIKFNLGPVNSINVVGSDDYEYTVSYFADKMPYGYAVVVFENNDAIIKEANLTPGQEGIYTELVDTVIDVSNISRKNLDINKQIIEISPTQYAISAKSVSSSSDKSTKVYDNYGNIISSNNLAAETTKYSKVNSIYINSKNWVNKKYKVDNSSKIILKKYTNRSKLFTESKVEKLTKKYCCVVQALLQIAYMENLTDASDSNIKSAYNKLWRYCSISETDDSKKNKSTNKITYGYGYIDDANKGFVKFAKEKGYSGTKEKSIKKDPSVDWIKDKLKYNRPILMFYGINVNGKRSGHAISILGYMKAKKVSSGNTWNYLMVYDSWNDSVHYLNYSTVDFMDCSATYFWVKKK